MRLMSVMVFTRCSLNRGQTRFAGQSPVAGRDKTGSCTFGWGEGVRLMSVMVVIGCLLNRGQTPFGDQSPVGGAGQKTDPWPLPPVFPLTPGSPSPVDRSSTGEGPGAEFEGISSENGGIFRVLGPEKGAAAGHV